MFLVELIRLQRITLAHCHVPELLSSGMAKARMIRSLFNADLKRKLRAEVCRELDRRERQRNKEYAPLLKILRRPLFSRRTMTRLVKVAAKDLQTAAEIHRNRLKSLDDDESRG